MDIPSYKSIMLPFLQYIGDSQEYHRKDIANALASNPFELTPEQRSVVRKSGHPVFDHHCDWAQYHLKRAGLIELPKRGYSKITDRGLALLEAWNNDPEEIEDAILKSPVKFYDYVNNRWPIKGKNDDNQTSEETIENEGDDNPTLEESIEVMNDSNQAPDESIETNYQQIRKELAAELVRQIKRNTSVFFEELVIDLLIAMGYGGSREDAQAVGRSGDGGIDGIINEDRLGLDVIYVQAKRWEGNVGEPPVRDFVGALQGKRARKGIFITTSEFTNSAQAYISAIDSRDSKVILIDGNQLAQLMIDHDVGVSVEKIYEIKRVDSDYFAENSENS